VGFYRCVVLRYLEVGQKVMLPSRIESFPDALFRDDAGAAEGWLCGECGVSVDLHSEVSSNLSVKQKGNKKL
jgi:hypothetical protein